MNRVYLVIAFALFAWSSLASAIEPAWQGCNATLSRTGVDLTGDFDPRRAFRQAGLDPDLISVRIEPSADGGMEGPSLEVYLYYGSKLMGILQLYQHRPARWGTYSALEDDFMGKGVGGIFYLIGTQMVFTRHPSATKLESWDASNEANYMWEKLVRSGRASKTPQDETGEDPRQFYWIERHHINDNLKSYVDQMKIHTPSKTSARK